MLNKAKPILLLIIALQCQFILGQQSPTGQVTTPTNIRFDDLIDSLEHTTSLQFYFNPEWTNDIIIPLPDSLTNIILALDHALRPYGMKVFSNENTVILYKGERIAEKLPDFQYAIAKEVEEKDQVVYLEKSAPPKSQENMNASEMVKPIRVGSPNLSSPNKTFIIRGNIVDKENELPLIGATVFIPELNRGAASDINGLFQLALKPGEYHMRIQSLSMKEKNVQLTVYSSGTFTVSLEKDLVSLNEVVVYADMVDNVGGLQMGFDRINSKKLKEIPVVMGEKDLLKVAQMLPGVQSAGEGTSGINVRGGTADQNLFYINQLPVYNTSHLFGFFTAFNPDIVNNFSLYKSNIPANYGGRVASVFDISTRQGNKKNFFAQGGISPITARASVEGPFIKDRLSYVLSYRTTYSDWILAKLDDVNLQKSSARFNDFSASLNAEINEKNFLKLFAYNSYDNFSLASLDDYEYSNTGGLVTLTHIMSPQVHLDLTALHTNYAFSHNNIANPSDAYTHEYRLDHSELKADFSWQVASKHKLLFGGSSILYNLHRGDITPYGNESILVPVYLAPEKASENAFYLSDEIGLNSKINFLVGVRYSFYGMFGPQEVNEYWPNSSKNYANIKEVLNYEQNELIKSYSGFEPRLAMNLLLGRSSSIKASYNRTRQYIFMLSNTVAVSPTDQWKLSDYHLKPPTADQVSFGFYHDFPKKAINTSVEVYRKRTQNIVEYKDGANFISHDPVEMSLLQGQQDSYGVELLLKKNTGKVSGWASYTYSRSSVLVDSELSEDRINYGIRYPSNFERPHSFNLVSTLKVNRRLSISGNVVYASGRPVTYPITSYTVKGIEVLQYSERNKYRIPDYFRIDCSLNLEGNLNKKKKVHSYWMFNVYNLTGRKNAYSVYFEPKKPDNKQQGYILSIFAQPIFTISWNFKFGNYDSE